MDIVKEILQLSSDKLRLILKDESFIDIRLSQRITNRFDFHWERRHLNKTIYRYDNFPDSQFRQFKLFPYHFHKETEGKVIETPFRRKLPEALTDFMKFVREVLTEKN